MLKFVAFRHKSFSTCEINISLKYPSVITSINLTQGRIQRGEGAAGRLQPSPNPPKPKFKKRTDFVDILISKVILDLSFSRNQPVKSAGD
jgi:hypothetical protein